MINKKKYYSSKIDNITHILIFLGLYLITIMNEKLLLETLNSNLTY